MSYFIPRGNRYYATIAPLSRTVRYAISLFLLSSCILGWYLLLYKPNKAQLQRCRSEKQTLQEQLRLSKNINKMVGAEQRKLKKMSADCASLQLKTSSDLLLTLAHEVKNTGLILDSCTQLNNQNTIALKTHGTHSALTQFLTTLKSYQNLYCTQCTILSCENKNYHLECSFEHSAQQKK